MSANLRFKIKNITDNKYVQKKVTFYPLNSPERITDFKLVNISLAKKYLNELRQVRPDLKFKIVIAKGGRFGKRLAKKVGLFLIMERF